MFGSALIRMRVSGSLMFGMYRCASRQRRAENAAHARARSSARGASRQPRSQYKHYNSHDGQCGPLVRVSTVVQSCIQSSTLMWKWPTLEFEM